MDAKIRESLAAIDPFCSDKPALGVILGSGLGAFADSFKNPKVIPFAQIPHFPSPTVPGHLGNLVLGISDGVALAALQGRVHLYEGYSMAEVAYPARILGCMGIRWLIVTNAAGAINPKLRPGDLMLITDHINLMGANPLVGKNLDVLGPRFPDMSEPYDLSLRRTALAVAEEKGIELHQGVYVGVCGPSYETPAEIRMLRVLGGDAVGMSTIPEVIVARHMGIPVLGICCIANLAAGMLPQRLSHEEVMQAVEGMRLKVFALLHGMVAHLAMDTTGSTDERSI